MSISEISKSQGSLCTASCVTMKTYRRSGRFGELNLMAASSKLTVKAISRGQLIEARRCAGLRTTEQPGRRLSCEPRRHVRAPLIVGC